MDNIAFPISGQIVDDEHQLMVRIYYEDTDFSGLVYHANYLKYFERGRSEYMRLLGVHHHQLANLETPLAFAVADIHIAYKVPARIDELICIRSRLIQARGASFTIEQRVTREDQLLAEGQVQVVCIDMAGRPKRMPKHLMGMIQSQVVSHSGA